MNKMKTIKKARASCPVCRVVNAARTALFALLSIPTSLPLGGLGWALTLVFPFALTSCSDFFDIKPQTELVSDDFWQNKSDVESAVAACYRAMQEPDVMERLIAWGEMRSDNVLLGQSYNRDVNYILTANVDAANGYAQWGPLYQVINYCNTVLEQMPAVQQLDPNFKVGELRAFEAEMKTLRALCYFYLVRTFGDVPFSLQAYSDDTRPFQLPRTSGDEILSSLLSELTSIGDNFAKSVYSSTAATKGRVTQKTLWTLMADISLWLGRYEECINLCRRTLQTSLNPLTLESAARYNRQLFGQGLSQESIFELVFDSYTPNYVVNEMYGTTGGRSSLNQLSALDWRNYSLFDGSDVRQHDFMFRNAGGAFIPIRKFVSYRRESNSTQVVAADYVTNQNTQPWIIYRLADVYLMMAEALVERNAEGDLTEALQMVSYTYDRANPSRGANSLSPSSYNAQELMRNLVFDERQREFMFEGKRYFDLLRRIRRFPGQLDNVVSTYLLRKYESLDQATVLTRLNTLNALYMPIHRDEMKVNKLLKQNPFYDTSSDIEKN